MLLSVFVAELLLLHFCYLMENYLFIFVQLQICCVTDGSGYTVKIYGSVAEWLRRSAKNPRG